MSAAASLAALPWEELACRFDPAQMNSDDVYPAIWDDDGALDYLRANYAVLVKFFDATAAAGDGVVLWLS